MKQNKKAQYIGRLKRKLFEKEFGKLQTTKVVLTDERELHIKEHHPNDFALLIKYGAKTIRKPDLIIKDGKNENTVFLIKQMTDMNVSLVLRLSLETDKKGFDNSIMTFYRLRNSNLKKLKSRNKILYTRENL